MWKAYLKGDAWVLSKSQDGYLWLLDRTGIYVATIAFFEYAASCALGILGGSGAILFLCVLAVVGLGLAHKYLMQDKGENEKFNLIAMMMESQSWRHWFNIIVLLFAVFEVYEIKPYSVLADLGFIYYGYLFLVKIRDRDKKPFFKLAEQHDLAMESSNVGL